MDGRGNNNSNPPEGSADKKMKRKDAAGQETQEESSATSIADRLVEMWKAGANFPPVFTPEVWTTIFFSSLPLFSL